MGGADDKYRFHLDPIAIERKQTPVLEQARDLGRRITTPFPYFIPLAASGLVFLRILVLCAPSFRTRWKLLLSTVCVFVSSCLINLRENEDLAIRKNILSLGWKINYQEEAFVKRERGRGMKVVLIFFQDFWLRWIIPCFYPLKREYYNLTGRYTTDSKQVRIREEKNENSMKNWKIFIHNVRDITFAELSFC